MKWHAKAGESPRRAKGVYRGRLRAPQGSERGLPACISPASPALRAGSPRSKDALHARTPSPRERGKHRPKAGQGKSHVPPAPRFSRASPARGGEGSALRLVAQWRVPLGPARGSFSEKFSLPESLVESTTSLSGAGLSGPAGSRAASGARGAFCRCGEMWGQVG